MLKTELVRADGSLNESFWAKPRELAWAGGMFDGTTKGVTNPENPRTLAADVKSLLFIPLRPCGDTSESFIEGVHDKTTVI